MARPRSRCETGAMSPEAVALHLGDLHPFEQALVYLLAFGPFLLLGIVVYVVRKRDLENEDDTDR